jgi:ribosome-binding factor A
LIRSLSFCERGSSAAKAVNEHKLVIAALKRCATQKQVRRFFNLSDMLTGFLHLECGLEHRGQKYHRGRLSEAIREEIETILEGELGDPRIGLARVSSVVMADDARSARVMVSVAGDESEAERTLEGLAAARNYVRHELAERLRLRRPPELYFQVDRAEELQSRVDELLAREKKRARKRAEPKP